ncbi:hypothetical protein CWS72_04755 [Telmatospirillum siberiense]|uniref:Uncharacterized protein n=2 Tax=Telmatospirillum siberiense TaxID=382514 RepID=A0A2N3PZR1_9PROT|nr:hypothetical protein CWS72_04755 [Telmatospirillum siberiense]
MDFWSVTFVSLSAGLVLTIGGALVIYMGSLVKSAYQLKIEIKGDVEEAFRRLEGDVEKKIRKVKHELVEEVDKIKVALQTDNQRKISEMLDGFSKRLSACETALASDRTEIGTVLEGLRRDVTVLDQRLRFVRREQKATREPQGVGATLEAAEAASDTASSTEGEADIPPADTDGDMATSGTA